MWTCRHSRFCLSSNRPLGHWWVCIPPAAVYRNVFQTISLREHFHRKAQETGSRNIHWYSWMTTSWKHSLQSSKPSSSALAKHTWILSVGPGVQQDAWRDFKPLKPWYMVWYKRSRLKSGRTSSKQSKKSKERLSKSISRTFTIQWLLEASNHNAETSCSVHVLCAVVDYIKWGQAELLVLIWKKKLN